MILGVFERNPFDTPQIKCLLTHPKIKCCLTHPINATDTSLEIEHHATHTKHASCFEITRNRQKTCKKALGNAGYVWENPGNHMERLYALSVRSYHNQGHDHVQHCQKRPWLYLS